MRKLTPKQQYAIAEAARRKRMQPFLEGVSHVALICVFIHASRVRGNDKRAGK